MSQGVIQQFLESLSFRDAKHSYSQSGEDLVMAFICDAMSLSSITYLDIGAYHPSLLSNTYLFYKKGASGVVLEPNPALCDAFRIRRPRDICLNVGVGRATGDSARFFVMSTPTLSTFSEVEAQRYEAMGTHRIEKVLIVQLVPVDQILQRYFPDCPPTIVSIDVEGLDLEILQTMDFKKARPSILCVETLSYSESRQEIKDANITCLMTSHGYFLYADTYINSIYVDRERWRQGATV